MVYSARFHEESLKCLLDAITLARHLEANEISFLFSKKGVTFYCLDTDHVSFVHGMMTPFSLHEFTPVGEEIMVTVNKDALCRFCLGIEETGMVVFLITPKSLKVENGISSKFLRRIVVESEDIERMRDIVKYLETSDKYNPRQENNVCTFAVKHDLIYQFFTDLIQIRANMLTNNQISNTIKHQEKIDGSVLLVDIRREENPKNTITIKPGLLEHESLFKPLDLPVDTEQVQLISDLMDAGGIFDFDRLYFLINLANGSKWGPYFQLRKDEPLMVTWDRGVARLTYILAPRLEDENNDDDADDIDEDLGDDIESGSKKVQKNYFMDIEVSEKEFKTNIEKYVDMEEWELRRDSEGNKYLVSRIPVLSKFPHVRGGISLETGNFGLYDLKLGKPFSVVSCRHLVLSGGNTLSFRRLPLVQSILGTVASFSSGNFFTFSPRLLIDGIGMENHGDVENKEDREKRSIIIEIVNSLLENMKSSDDKYKKAYYMGYIIYAIRRIFTDIDDGFLFFEDNPREEKFKEMARMMENSHVLDAMMNLDSFELDAHSFCDAYMDHLLLKHDLVDFIDIRDNAPYLSHEFEIVFLTAIRHFLEFDSEFLKYQPESLEQALTRFHSGDGSALNSLMLHVLDKLEWISTAVQYSRLSKGYHGYRLPSIEEIIGKRKECFDVFLREKIMPLIHDLSNRIRDVIENVEAIIGRDFTLNIPEFHPIMNVLFCEFYFHFKNLRGDVFEEKEKILDPIVEDIFRVIFGDDRVTRWNEAIKEFSLKDKNRRIEEDHDREIFDVDQIQLGR